MTHAEDLAYLRAKMGAAEFEALMEAWAMQLRGLEAGDASGCIEIKQNVHGGDVSDTLFHPPPVRLRTVAREKRLRFKAV